MNNTLMAYPAPERHSPPDTNGLGHSRDAWRDMTAAKLCKQQVDVIDAMRQMMARGTSRFHYLDVWRHMAQNNREIVSTSVCSRIGELITAGCLRVVPGAKDPSGRKGRIVELVARQASIKGV